MFEFTGELIAGEAWIREYASKTNTEFYKEKNDTTDRFRNLEKQTVAIERNFGRLPLFVRSLIEIQTLKDDGFNLYLKYRQGTPPDRNVYTELQSYRDRLTKAIAEYELHSGNATTKLNIYLTALKEGRVIPDEENFVEDAFRDVQVFLYEASRRQGANVFGWTEIS